MNTPLSLSRRVRQHRTASMLKMLLLLLCTSAVPIPMFGQQPALPKLTLAQVTDLAIHKVPDSTLSIQIERRGISFTPNPAILDSLRAKGAGPLTLAALTRLETSARPEPSHSAPAVPHAAKLTQAQLQHLIRIRASDSFVAHQLQARGLGYPLTNADVATLASQGAGPRTLDALRGLVVTGSIQIRTERGAAVAFDGKPAGVVDIRGQFLLQDVLPSSHTLSIAKEGFHPYTQSFTLGDRENRQLAAPLSWAGALLSITAEPSSASITVAGPVSYSGPLDGAHCPPGNYTVTVSAPGYASQTQSVVLVADQSYQKDFHLLVDPAFLAKTVADAQAALGAGDPASAARLSAQVLTLDPSSHPAHRVLATASFLQGDFPSFLQNAHTAIQGGESITVPLLHVHAFPRLSTERVNLTISAQGLAFACQAGAKCKLPDSLNYGILGTPAIMNDPSGAMQTLHITWVSGGQHFVGVAHELDFVPIGAQMAKGPRNPNTSIFSSGEYLATPQDAVPEYEAIILLIAMSR